MRRIVWYLALSLLLFSCSKAEQDIIPQCNMKQDSFSVSYSMALRLACARTDFGDFIEITPHVEHHDTLFYIAYYSKGWSLIPADSRVEPFLANSSGNFSISGENNIGHKEWLKDLTDFLKTLKKNSGQTIKSNITNSLWDACQGKIAAKTKSAPNHVDTIDVGTSRWVRIRQASTLFSYDSIKVDHLIQTKWGQESPWNRGLPFYISKNDTIRLPLGCSATAFGQLLYYFHYNLHKPNGLYHSISFSFQPISYYPLSYSVNVNRSNYVNNSDRWDEMPVDSLGINLSLVRDFLIDIGEKMNTSYSFLGSGTDLLSTSFFANYNLSCTLDNYHTSSIKEDLLNGLPVLMMGHSTDNSGHTWLIDGMIERQWTYRQNYIWQSESSEDPMIYDDSHTYYTEGEAFSLFPNLYDGMTEFEDTTHSELYLLMNWGYDGAYDEVEYAAFGSYPWIVGDIPKVYPAGFYNKYIYYHFQ